MKRNEDNDNLQPTAHRPTAHSPRAQSPEPRARIIRRTFRVCLLSAAGCFLFVVLSLKLASTANAQLPTPTCTITPTPSVTPSPTLVPCGTPCAPHATPTPPHDPTATPIPSPYQLPVGQGVLEWRPYAPSGSPPWPCVLLVHPGGFHQGSMYGHVEELVAQDLVAAGYYTLIVSYRLAPCDVIKEQPCHDDDALTGRPPQQTDDIKAEVRAIRADTTHCNGKVAIVGGSAGGSHALFLALDTITTSTWNASLRPTCVVSLSGAYDLSDRTPENYGPHHTSPVEAFAYDVWNYVNDISPTVQKAKSPISLVFTPRRPNLLYPAC